MLRVLLLVTMLQSPTSAVGAEGGDDVAHSKETAIDKVWGSDYQDESSSKQNSKHDLDEHKVNHHETGCKVYNLTSNSCDDEAFLPFTTGTFDAGSVDESGGTLFLAPSSIPGAGLGVYTTVDIPRGAIVGGDDDYGDLFVPLEDTYKVLPCKGQQRFLSWLACIWPEETDAFYHTRWDSFFPELPESFHRISEGLSGVDPKESIRFSKSKKGDDAQEAVSAFAPGLASMVNTHSLMSKNNIEKADLCQRSDDDDSDQESHYHHPGKGAHAGDHGVVFVATKDIAAGSELFLDYGDEWCRRCSDVPLFSSTEDMWEFREQQARDMSLISMPTEQGKRRRMEQMGPEINELMGNYEIKGHTHTPDFKRVYAHDGDDAFGEHMNEFDDDAGEDSEDDHIGEEEDGTEQDTFDQDGYNDEDDDEVDVEDCGNDEHEKHNHCDGETIIKTGNSHEGNMSTQAAREETSQRLEWIRENGMSIDNLRTGPAQVDPIAGRGAFAKRFLPHGSVIAPSPLLVLKRDDLVNYKANKNKKWVRNVLDLDKVVGQDLLLNHCCGHPDSELLLLPYAPIVNFINHDSREPNAEIRWPSHTSPWFPGSRDWFSMHPLDVQDWSGPHLKVEFVALRDIRPGEEILIDYGSAWEDAWKAHLENYPMRDSTEGAGPWPKVKPFRHEIGVPDMFYPREWKHKSMIYEVAPLESPLEPGEVSLMRFAHNNEPIAKNLYRVGLPRGFSSSVKDYSDQLGITGLYEKLLSARGKEQILQDNEWQVFSTQGEQWFAQRHQSSEWTFNMHYIAPWDETARQSMLAALGRAGFDVALEGTAKHLGLDNMTCWHSSFMGVSHADSVSRPHADVYSTGEKGFNYIFPLLLVNGSAPELDIQTDDHNVLIGVNYEYDVAYALGDFVYHKTRGIEYADKNQIRIMVGTYCSQINAGDERITSYIYHGEDPAPFMDQFKAPIKEAHYGNGHKLPKV